MERDDRERLLGIYLNDHLAGATIGSELVRRAAGSNADNELGRFLASLEQEVAADREALLSVMAALGVRASRAKVAAAWAAEKAGRLKLNGRIVRYSPLSRILELEGLAIGIRGKRGMWQLLGELEDERLASFDFPALVARADAQLADVERTHADVARATFGARSEPREGGS